MLDQIKIRLVPTLKQDKAWTLLNDSVTSFLLFGGGAGGGKSWLGCEWLLVNCYRYPSSKWFIGREELTRLKSTTLLTWYKVCAYHKIPRDDWKYNGQDHYIEFKNGSRVDLLDLKYLPTDPLYERYGSSEYTGGWIEEAGEVNFGAFDVLKSRIGRHLNDKYGLNPAKLLITSNPKKNWVYEHFYKPWIQQGKPEVWQDKLGNGYAFVQALVGDNTYQESGYQRNLMSLTDIVQKQRLLFGNWEYDDDPSAIMNYAAISDLFTNSLPSQQGNFLSVDVARFGEDKTVFTLWKGMRAISIKPFSRQATDVTSELIRQYAKDYQIPYSQIVVDEDGIGGGVVDVLPGIVGFVGNHSPMDVWEQRPNYRNLRSQCYFLLAERVNNHKMAIEIQDEEIKADLIQELEQIKIANADKDAPKQIIPKDEIRQVIGRSPDYADTLMMRMVLEPSINDKNYQQMINQPPEDKYGLFAEI